MLDKRSLKLLEYIDKECQSGGYKVFTTKELISAFPEDDIADEDGVRECVRTLADREYISVKYQDDAEVCLMPLSKGRLVFENRLDDEIEKFRAERRYFIFSFLGAMAGGFIVALIVAAVLLLAGGG